MLTLIKELFSLLTPAQRKRFYGLQVLVVLMAFAEILGVASIAPFMALVGDPTILERDNLVASIYQYSNLTQQDYIFWLGVAVLSMLFLASLISMFTTWRLSMFSAQIGIEIGDRLYAHYLNQPWLFHASGSSAQLTKNVANESGRITNQIIRPLMQINAKLGIVIFMSIGLMIYDPLVAMAGLLIFAIAYLVLYKLIKKRVHDNGKNLSMVATQRYRLMNEGFGGIKDTLLLGRQADFVDRFNQSGKLFSYSMGTNAAIGQVPRYFMELLAFGTMISMVLYLIAKHEGNLGMILPILSVYALAGFKLLPAFQLIYNSVTQIKGAAPAFYAIREDLIASKNRTEDEGQKRPVDSKLIVKDQIKLNQVCFTYPGKEEPALNKLNMTIKVNSVVGIVGASGSGKSTLIDVILGLIAPQHGKLLVDGKEITEQNKRAWQNTIGFVPQAIFLSEGTIAENVAFGVPENEIDFEQVKKALTLAHLDELVTSLDNGIHAKVGERGVQLSGGQRQRIGIARALYHEADVLVFDEATSALDGITEKMIMDAIHDFSGQKTIIMIAHRLKTVQKCDQIFVLDKGKLVDQGNYQYLLENNEQFKEMAVHA